MGRKKSKYIAIVAIIIIMAVSFLLGGWLRVAWSNRGTKALHAGSHQFNLQVADTESKREKGLGGRKGMAANSGMLFVFQKSNIACFWMKGMDFPLDIVWVNANKSVVGIASNVSPATYPHQFCPKTPSRYVIELNAGAVAQAGIQKGQTLHF
jgi:hypothetical protein